MKFFFENVSHTLLMANEILPKDYNIETLKWTQIGAIGSWAGSIFGAIALIISIIALYRPRRIKMSVSIASAVMVDYNNTQDDVYSYVITVKNICIRPVTIKNIYLNFGGKNRENLYVGMINDTTLLKGVNPRFPAKIGQGEKIDYYLSKERLKNALEKFYHDKPLGEILNICVDEVEKGQKYYKTKWTLGTFLK